MAISVNSTNVYAKFQTVEFTTDIVGDKIIEFGDGNFEFFTGSSIQHTYNIYGEYKACVRLCEEELPQEVNCIDINVTEFVDDVVMITEFELSSCAGVESDIYTHEVCLSANCPPPLKIDLRALNTISRPVNNINDKNGNCDPVHFFYTNIPIEENTITINDPAKIFVNGKVAGYRGNFCFGYYDDYVGNINLEVTLRKECDICLESTPEYKLYEVWWGGGLLDDTINVDFGGERFGANRLGYIPNSFPPDPYGNTPTQPLRKLIGNQFNGDKLVVGYNHLENIVAYISNIIGPSGGDITNILFVPID